MAAIQQVMMTYGGVTTPSGIPNIWMWGEPSLEVGLNDGDPMATLTDQTGNARNFTQSTTAFKPLYKTGILNSLACARGEGWNGGNACHWVAGGADTTGLTGAHAFIVAKPDTEGVTADTNGLWQLGPFAGGVEDTYYPWTDGVIYDKTLTSARKTVGNPSMALDAWRVVEVVSVSGEFTFKLDGTQIFTTATNTFAGAANGRIMRNNSNSALKGYVAGLYIFSAKLGSTDRTTLINYINSRFGLSSS